MFGYQLKGSTFLIYHSATNLRYSCNNNMHRCIIIFLTFSSYNTTPKNGNIYYCQPFNISKSLKLFLKILFEKKKDLIVYLHRLEDS